jgi:glycosyltransferase 2 family protein
MMLACAILCLLLFPMYFRPIAVTSGQFLVKYLPSLGKKIIAEIDKVFFALAHTSDRGMMLQLIFYSSLAWLAEGGVFWLVALCLPSMANQSAVWLALPVGTLATVIPSTPGYVGTFDYFTIKAMVFLGNSLVDSTAFAFLVHAVLWLPPTFAGGLYLLLNPAQLHKEVKVFRS